MNDSLKVVSDILHTPLHIPFTHHVKKSVNLTLEPGGETYTQYIKALRTVIGSSDSNNVEQNIRKAIQGIRIIRIDIKTLHERGGGGLRTCDDFGVEVFAEFEFDILVKFG